MGSRERGVHPKKARTLSMLKGLKGPSYFRDRVRAGFSMISVNETIITWYITDGTEGGFSEGMWSRKKDVKGFFDQRESRKKVPDGDPFRFTSQEF